MPTFVDRARAQVKHDREAGASNDADEKLCSMFHVVDTSGTKQPVGMILNGLSSGLLQCVQSLRGQIVELRAELDMIKQKGVEFCGTYVRAMPYRRGSLVVKDGSLRAAIRDVEPGDVPPGGNWALCAKAGANGRDGKNLR
jgi:hypothetical protein